MLKIINSPEKYVQGQGELGKLQTYIAHLGKKTAYAIVDPYIHEHYKDLICSSFQEQSEQIILEIFAGECSKQEINRLIEAMKKQNANIVIGIGGGKTLDTAKAVSYYTDLPVIIAPTAASTDAPCSALSVLYHENGEFDQYLFLKQNPNIVLVDTDIITNAPVRLLVAGIGDALATYYEARACYQAQATTIAGGICSNAALALAEECLDILFADGLKAKLAVEQHTVSAAVENIIEANTYLSGVGFESGGLAGAHAIHNGLTVLEECHHMLHGEKVAFGTLVQLVLENADLEEIEEIIDFCKSLGLPTNLADLGVQKIESEKLMAVATAACAENDTLHNMPFKVTPEDVYSAILVANQLGK